MTTTEKEALKDLNSQICTTREQSEHLLALGLKKETADMCYRYVNTVKGEKKYELIVEAAWSQEVIDEYVRFGTKIGLFDNLVHPCGKPVTPLEARADVTKNDIPAWSLGRLIEMLPSPIHPKEELPSFSGCAYLNLAQIAVWYDYTDYDMDDRTLISWSGNGFFSAVVNCIEWLIKEGYFNKEYLV
jgi:hypothetical protein